ncbi:MAG: YggS family pyridoxal phosphate-dependent enzyme [Acidobacteria bacterium]|nr:YggS family pyridoxal phosphate-dependent enzyme [Acidobacteriota bacterium]
MVAMSYQDVVDRISAAASQAGRSESEITLIAVSKLKSVLEILEVYQKGHRDFGENRANEMAGKAPELPDDIRWHFVGSLQSNKARLVRPITHLLHSMDRDSLASAWTKGPGLPPTVLVQVNVGSEPQKSGVEPGEVEGFVDQLVARGMNVAGLMAIPPVPELSEQSREYFRALRQLRDQVRRQHPGVIELSMGMTDDFEVAIAEGASMIRVGRAIFGPRT